MTATLEHEMTAPLAYEPPGPGAWTLDVDHQASPRGALMQELVTPNFVGGFETCFARYGMPLDRLEGRHVNGWFFLRAVPAGVPDTGKAPPPALVLKLLTRLSPELRRRRRTAADTIAGKRWLADARAWAAERHEWVARAEGLLAIDLNELDDAALAEHVGLAHTLAGDMTRRHFSLVGATVAIGRLLIAGRSWGLTPDVLVSALRGSSPASTASRAPLTELAALTGGGADLDTAAALRAVSPRAAELVDHYLCHYGWRPLGADVEAPTLAEHPDQLVELVRSQAIEGSPAGSSDPAAGLRQRVPAGARTELDQLLAEARECFASLDDNSGIAAWTVGVLRRAVLEAGRRAHARGAINDRDDVFNLELGELLDLIDGGTPVEPGELARRRDERAAAALQLPPRVLGGPEVEPPDPSVFPGPLAVLAAAVGAYLAQKFTAGTETVQPQRTGALHVDGLPPVAGVPVVAGTVVGRIIVSRDPADAIARIEPGDILVCPYTTAAHNAIFPMLGGVLTQFGGPLGHTAVMAREFGIPAVVGARSLPVHLDGLEGELTVDPLN